MTKGDIVLISFPFTNLKNSKLRPALIIASTNLDLTLCFITSQLKWQEATDIVIIPNNQNGIKQQSLIRISKIATIDKNLAMGLIGKLNRNEILELNTKLKILLQLN